MFISLVLSNFFFLARNILLWNSSLNELMEWNTELSVVWTLSREGSVFPLPVDWLC